AHAHRHSVDVPGGTGSGLRDDASHRVEDATPETLRLAHYGGESGTHEGSLLLVGHRQQSTPQHLQRDRVDTRTYSHTLTLRAASTSIRASGPTTVVDSRSSIMAGPSSAVPGASTYRS